MAKKALGKGLSALITPPLDKKVPPAEKIDPRDRVVWRALDDIVPNERQPRRHFAPGALEDLVNSIREHGLMQPLVVRPLGKKWELIAGERRWRASQALQLEKVPTLLREAADREALELALVENIQRENLNPLEEAQAFQRLADEFGLSQNDIAQRVGKSRPTVANILRILDLDEEVQSLIAQGRLTLGHAKALLMVSDVEAQRALAQLVVKKNLSVRATEQKASVGSASSAKKKKSVGLVVLPDAHLLALEEKLREHLSTQVHLHAQKSGKGQIQIEFYSDDDLERLLEKMGVRWEVE